MNGLPSYFDIDRYGIRPEDVVRVYLRCRPDEIAEKVIITPVWGSKPFCSHVQDLTAVAEGLCWNLRYKGRRITIIRSGMGAPITGDITLALSFTPCRSILFTGSAGGLLPTMNIGDLIISDSSLSGDGFSRYLSSEVNPHDCFRDSVLPDLELTGRAKGIVIDASSGSPVGIHVGKVYCIDTILAQFFRLEAIAVEHGCIAVDMETAACFKAATLVGIRSAGVLQISDVLPLKKSFFSGRTEEENRFRQEIKRTILARSVLEALIQE